MKNNGKFQRLCIVNVIFPNKLMYGFILESCLTLFFVIKFKFNIRFKLLKTISLTVQPHKLPSLEFFFCNVKDLYTLPHLIF